MFHFNKKKAGDPEEGQIEVPQSSAIEDQPDETEPSQPLNKEEDEMFGEKGEAVRLETTSPGVTTILDKECSFEGKLTFEGTVAIYGKFKGEIFSEGELVIGQGGHVEGKIDIGTIRIEGEVKGNIKAKEKIEINAPAVVQGDINAPSLIIKEGALFEGTCSMGRREKENVVDFSAHNPE